MLFGETAGQSEDVTVWGGASKAPLSLTSVCSHACLHSRAAPFSVPIPRRGGVQDKARSGCLLQNTWRRQRASLASLSVQAPTVTQSHTQR